MHAMTAAHRTLPLGSIVRVTNLKTGHAALVRITDRGPFIQGRILDLSLAAAKKLDVYLPGTAEVKVEVMHTPVPIETGGRWAVQIGAFAKEGEARRIADQLTRRYRTAKVQHFGSPVGDWWVRVRVLDDDRETARKVVAETRTPEGAATGRDSSCPAIFYCRGFTSRMLWFWQRCNDDQRSSQPLSILPCSARRDSCQEGL
jgi:rare lipoprotein A